MRRIITGAVALALIASTAVATYSVTHPEVPTIPAGADITVTPCGQAHMDLTLEHVCYGLDGNLHYVR